MLKQRWFPVSARRWFWLAEAEISGGGTSGSSRLPPNRSRFVGGGGAGAPLGWSWRCQELRAPGEWMSGSDPQAWSISISGLQVIS